MFFKYKSKILFLEKINFSYNMGFNFFSSKLFIYFSYKTPDKVKKSDLTFLHSHSSDNLITSLIIG